MAIMQRQCGGHSKIFILIEYLIMIKGITTEQTLSNQQLSSKKINCALLLSSTWIDIFVVNPHKIFTRAKNYFSIVPTRFLRIFFVTRLKIIPDFTLYPQLFFEIIHGNIFEVNGRPFVVFVTERMTFSTKLWTVIKRKLFYSIC